MMIYPPGKYDMKFYHFISDAPFCPDINQTNCRLSAFVIRSTTKYRAQKTEYWNGNSGNCTFLMSLLHSGRRDATTVITPLVLWIVESTCAKPEEE